MKPMRVYAAPEETVLVQVSIEELNRVPEADVSEAQTYPFFCPLHKGEETFRNQIQIVP
ncbi:MAG: hypothetical protein IPM58_08020 [Nitrospira sp.]|nr:hypothetical protein [Nitrospira sp.]